MPALSLNRSSLRAVLGLTNTVLSLGLNLLIPRLRRSRWGKIALVLLVLNEVRGIALAAEGFRSVLIPLWA